MAGSRFLTITGDDFGASAGANSAIAEAHEHGVLTAASLMVCGPAFQDAVERARALPTLSTGLHLVLCDGRAASDARSIPDLVDPQGRFPDSAASTGLRLWLQRRRVREQLRREISAQVERYLASGLPLDHVDGHHHLHMHPVIFDLLLECLAEFRVTRVRLMHEDRAGREPGDGPLSGLVPTVHGLLARRHRRHFADAWTRGRRARVYGLRATGRLDESRLLSLVARLRAPRVEIYAHPDRDDEGGRRELAALCSSRLRSAIERSGYMLESREVRAAADEAA